MQQLKFYWVVPAYHTEFGLATICLEACGTIPVAWESICKDRRFSQLLKKLLGLFFFTRKPTNMTSVQTQDRQLELSKEYVFLSVGDR